MKILYCSGALLVTLMSLNAQTPADSRDQVFYPGDTESVVPLTSKLVKNVILDQKAVWTSPFHMNRDNAKYWILFGGAAAALVATDHRTSTIFENSSGQVAWGNHASWLGSTYTLVPVAAGFYAWGAVDRDSKARETGVLGGEALIDILIESEILKLAAGRNRPNDAKEPGQFFDGGASFPSGHAMGSWALAAIIAHEYRHKKAVPILAYGLAAAVGGARYAARQHYLSDIVVGSAMGYFTGTYVFNTHELHASHLHASIRPYIQPQTESLGLSLSLGR